MRRRCSASTAPHAGTSASGRPSVAAAISVSAICRSAARRRSSPSPGKRPSDLTGQKLGGGWPGRLVVQGLGALARQDAQRHGAGIARSQDADETDIAAGVAADRRFGLRNRASLTTDLGEPLLAQLAFQSVLDERARA